MTRKTVPAPVQRRRLARLDHAAVYADCSVKTMRRRISDGTLTGYRLGPGRSVLIDLDEIDNRLRRIPTVGGDAA